MSAVTQVPPLAPWDKAQSRGRVLGSPYAALGEVPYSHDHRIALSACVQAEGDSNATTYVSAAAPLSVPLIIYVSTSVRRAAGVHDVGHEDPDQQGVRDWHY